MPCEERPPQVDDVQHGTMHAARTCGVVSFQVVVHHTLGVHLPQAAAQYAQGAQHSLHVALHQELVVYSSMTNSWIRRKS
ncbi:hypothetical protein E2C01_016787 [Portunus trituberculatus]|uniref:Uncharacterized protein n=1 Tax=Portunus trituberculatus TaxID=210409 RepID=A0A5B7DS37_PORTR|nr:hypothetical protein [Portunus trituberculatus]